MDENKINQLLDEMQYQFLNMHKDYEAEHLMDHYPYNYTELDGSMITIRRKTQEEWRHGVELCIASMFALESPKSSIRIDPDLFGYAYRDAWDNTIVVVEYGDYVALILYREKAFSASRFAEAVEQVETPILAAMD